MAESDHTQGEGAEQGERPEQKPEQRPEQRLEQLLERHLPALRGFLNRRAAEFVLARESAEDLAQSACRDVVEQLHDGRFTLRTDAEFKQWLYEAGVLKLKTRYRFHRADKRDPAREIPMDVQPTTSGSQAPGIDPATSATPSRLVSVEENRAAVRAAVDTLGARDAEAIRLVVFEGLPNGEAAEKLALDPAHFRVVLSRAMAKLSKTLLDGGGGDAAGR